MTTLIRTLISLFASSVLLLAAVPADAHGRGGYYYGGPGPFWGGVGIGVGIGLTTSPYYYSRPWYPNYVVVEPAPVYVREGRPVPAVAEPAAKAAPDPIFYPRNAQSAAQTEADRVECNRWATTQQSAMTDASVFQRATYACMEGRGYVVK